MSTVLAPVLDAPPLQRIGLPEYVKAASPAAGANFSQAIDGSNFVRLVTVWCRLVTDANVGNRTVYVEYRDPEANTVLIAGAPVTQSASDTVDYGFQAFVGQSDWEVAGAVLVTLPPLLLLPTFSWRIVVDTIKAGDQLSAIRYVHERFSTTGQPALQG